MTTQSAAPSLESRSLWYVYELVDPRDESVFYIGKGKGSRIDDHEREALKGVCSRKTKRINDIRQAKCEIVKRKVAFFWDEQAAYDHETDRIDEVGLENLTNVLPGGQKAWVNRIAKRRAVVQRDKELTSFQLVMKYLERFAYWLRDSEGGKKKIEHISIKGFVDPKMAHWYEQLTMVCFNDFLPKTFTEAMKDEKNHQSIIDGLKKYNIILQVEGAQHGCA